MAEPGRQLASTPLPEHESREIAREVIDGMKRWDSANAGTIEAAAGNVDPVGKTPAQITDEIVRALGNYLDTTALADANNWQSGEQAAGNPCTNADRDAKRDELRAEYEEVIRNMSRGSLTERLAQPVFTIADSNWGDANEDIFFVIAPDPVTGEATMYQQTQPGGDLWPLGDDWVNTSWHSIEKEAP